ncbi:NADP-dependent aldehyde dehydrogenase [Actinomadura pelletieri DSM 43383]|uniref:NADP-dependent aldehyde dehydrogenase n=1 Tax=Actinomadura pelletieri DSM 43383 TaxID=1120940 RepID=A0A495QTG0_9ACTN|nr:aldehyde dehydrogenase (NADP(+)) [Actinomadura pelletieri]RKS76707.1 NADP-dependent aldehyde dehydrogenase [Actinomadura pelletieri DSM 43383]
MSAPAETTVNGVAEVCAAAATAAPGFAALPLPERAGLLRDVAGALRQAEPEIVALADRETALGPERLVGELARTTHQLDRFADGILDGRFREVIVDRNGPGPDLRRMLVPLGPVAVFAASNFPLAFSVAGGDTASALAAGCPVVVKAHPGHPRLSELCAMLAAEVLPEGVLALTHGMEAGRALVTDPHIRAAAFTGSASGGRALADLAHARPDPIPFYGELGSLNPVVVTAAAVEARGPEIADGFVASYTLGSGQFCTKPGVVLISRGHGLDERLVEAVSRVAPRRLLSERIATAYRDGVATLAATPGVTPLVRPEPTSGDVAAPALFKVPARELAGPLLEECFGPVSVLAEYDSVADLTAAVERLPGSLTMTIHAEPSDIALVRTLLVAATARAGRIVHNGWPTGVTVSPAMQHGGPWPSTTDPLHTSVGFTAIRRFLRPVVFQDVPDEFLPAPLRDTDDRHPHTGDS